MSFTGEREILFWILIFVGIIIQFQFHVLLQMSNMKNLYSREKGGTRYRNFENNWRKKIGELITIFRLVVAPTNVSSKSGYEYYVYLPLNQRSDRVLCLLKYKVNMALFGY